MVNSLQICADSIPEPVNYPSHRIPLLYFHERLLSFVILEVYPDDLFRREILIYCGLTNDYDEYEK